MKEQVYSLGHFLIHHCRLKTKLQLLNPLEGVILTQKALNDLGTKSSKEHFSLHLSAQVLRSV